MVFVGGIIVDYNTNKCCASGARRRCISASVAILRSAVLHFVLDQYWHLFRTARYTLKKKSVVGWQRRGIPFILATMTKCMSSGMCLCLLISHVLE
eukprot:m.721995 g.721995  ORF g.721995 m.721995 type:complete len:96 (+) comp23015_c0_seq1:34-321(+)